MCLRVYYETNDQKFLFSNKSPLKENEPYLKLPWDLVESKFRTSTQNSYRNQQLIISEMKLFFPNSFAFYSCATLLNAYSCATKIVAQL